MGGSKNVSANLAIASRNFAAISIVDIEVLVSRASLSLPPP